MNLEEWKCFFKQKQESLLQSSYSDEIDVQSSDEEETSQSMQLQRMANSLQQRNKDSLFRVQRALARIASGDFGSCQECGEDIAEARLKALPDAIVCISCAEEQEMQKHIYS